MTSAASVARGRPAPPLRAIATVAMCAFLIAWLFLAWQLRAGRDPALGTAAPAPSAPHVASPAKHHTTPVLVTRTSGGGG